jgi:tartrate dehydratase beta subunit/fumarate hydratase class I family protein
MEAIHEFRVENMPVTVAVDARGRSIHDFTLRAIRG